jgi:prevent-host-death family protein
MEISASKFKARCLELMDRVHEFGEEILITKRGKPVAKLGPVSSRKVGSSFGCMSKRGKIVSEIESPVEVEWDAMKGILLNE